MKNLIFLAVLGVAGYFTYQYFVVPWLEDNAPPAPTFNYYSLPEKCQSDGENLEVAIYRYKIREMKKTTADGYAQRFRRCLRIYGGYTRSEIAESYEKIKDIAEYKAR